MLELSPGQGRIAIEAKRTGNSPPKKLLDLELTPGCIVRPKTIQEGGFPKPRDVRSKS